ncbi:MAG: hypothetical protein V4564_16035 [Pseudomonadota bacterium]|uniref:hypothetical protein n=1 Tax=Sphingomonas sp. ERG5 TaxID=1381597 RepID=UPI00054C774B|nr:hypothetical protein [Sphingomonas sp. ERG5]
MKNMMKKVVLGATLAATALTAAAPAEAQRYGYGRHYHRGNDAGVAVVAGIAGLAIGAAIASDGRRNRDREIYYRDRGYDPYYDDNYYRERGYYPNDGYYAYRYRERYYSRCHIERRWDDYYDRPVRIRVCD